MFQVFAELSIMNYLRLLAETAVLTFVIYRIYVAISDTKATEVLSLVFTVMVAPQSRICFSACCALMC